MVQKIKVHVVHSTYAVNSMLQDFGFETVGPKLLHTADFIQFTGGPDVNPRLYGEEPHSRTRVTDNLRDTMETVVFKRALDRGIPMVGICRGAQFLNVMNMGSLWQDVDRHALVGTHDMVDLETKEKLKVTSTHHQMMRPTCDAEIIGVSSESTMKHKTENGSEVVVPDKNHEDVEVVFYPETKSLCFQPHPEHMGHVRLKHYYYELLKRKKIISCV